jgi:hypothetical protein
MNASEEGREKGCMGRRGRSGSEEREGKEREREKRQSKGRSEWRAAAFVMVTGTTASEQKSKGGVGTVTALLREGERESEGKSGRRAKKTKRVTLPLFRHATMPRHLYTRSPLWAQ